MTLTRNQFFILLFLVIFLTLSLSKLLWLATASSTTGVVSFTGHGNLGAALGISSYPVVRFVTGRDTIFFNGNADLKLKEGLVVPVLYQKGDPVDAKINTFLAIWGDTIAYALGPLLIFIALFLIPDVFPRHSVIRFSRKRFFSFVSEKGAPIP